MAWLTPFGRKQAAAPRRDGSQNRALIRGVISLACELGSAIRVNRKGGERIFSTKFMWMDADGGRFYIRSIGLGGLEEGLAAGRGEVTAYFKLNGIQYSFDSVYLGAENRGKAGAIALRIPSKMKAGQRRSSFRISPSERMPALVIVDGAHAHAINISGSGLCFGLGRPVEPGTVLPLKLRLPTHDEDIHARVEVVAYDNGALSSEGGAHYRIRGRFKGLPGAAVQTIHRYVLDAQRELINTFGRIPEMA